MSIEYIASIAQADYKMFRILVTTPLPDDYETWLLVRERGKLRALTGGAATVTEIEVSLMEFAAYCKALKNPNFSIGTLDQCARDKAMAQARVVPQGDQRSASSSQPIRTGAALVTSCDQS
jgi:hypothetical protein